MERNKVKRQALQILQEQTQTPIIGLKQYTETPQINSEQIELYKEFEIQNTLYVVWKQQQEQPKVSKKELITYVR